MTGLISLGHGIFLMVGAVTAALLERELNAPIWITIPSAGVVTALVGSIVGLPSLRLKGFYLALATLAGHYVIYFIFWNFDWLCGSQGITMSSPVLFGVDLSESRQYYYLILVIAVVMFWVACNLKRTKVGRAFQAIRDRDIAAEIIGIELWRYKLISFAISSFYAGVAGALTAHMLTLVAPEHFTLGLSIQYLAMIIVGGQGYIFGAILGSFFMTLVPMWLEGFLEILPVASLGLEIGSVTTGGLELFFGMTIVLFLIFEPEGLAKIWKDIFSYFRLWPFAY
jgi:branched-chain amino acid transport system permease protein